METTTKILERNYFSTNDFVAINNLEKQAIELFGENWEPEDDCTQIEQLLEFIGAKFYEVEFIEECKHTNDIKVWHNETQFELDKYKKGYNELMCYFDSISDEEQPKLHKRLIKLGL